MASTCAMRSLGWILGKISSLKVWAGSGTGCTGKCWSHYPWSCSKMWTWDSVWETAGLDLRALFQS